ncbi:MULTISPECIES: polyphosphate kinase 1 [Vibrio]|jgi:polyphosphate kinase|uniref:Polyphosphate kinase n=2 Tax=Vibrio harveyi group TaxID=717610 RepID=A0A0H0YKC1_VIBAL|nr:MULTISPECIES: polyphosphate kinase 1 [Vibrio]MDG2626880.1 polyphosphate kinase 1 [Vibrio parahaemolyticus]MDW1809277.1 polyphosphate kinase 1 [Vibrio sp. Vb2362]MDW1971523.1 polyphosphate kinase 1 [Vibrio sp. 945]MDW2259271.1 polyphosphate kinase 1 [Vibrio sp. 1409]MDW2295558.1 polyphosphate kinase 1 [Vibrio sp. 1404]NAW94168.1 polyphosphate kinase 1 [Vibrio sp. V42_P2S4T144]QCO85085.1 polyphosphate kinase 1 [Vibrio neocaledonicus]QIR87678.1 polyphosphate kinase 1 [Vibrio diabolicus]
MSAEKLYIEKELSWLSFNERVLQEAADKTVPLIERIRFLGIFSNNLDEFYKVRFADVKRRILISQERGGSDSPKRLLTKMQSKALKLNEQFDELYSELIREMARRRIFLVNEQQLDESQQKWIAKYFRREVMPHITPLLMKDEIDVLQFLKDEYAYIAVELRKEEHYQYALIEIPTDHLPRFVMVPEQKGKRRKTIILLDNIIRHCLDELFKGFFDYDELSGYAMKMTRDAEYDLRNEIEYSLLEQMSEGVNQRLTAKPVRFVYERDMPPQMLEFLCNKLNISNYDNLIPGGRYHNFKDFIGFPNVGREYLENKPLPPMKCADFEGYANSFDAIKAKDILLYYPYHTFDHISELVRQASFDPKVLSIKINIYRVAKDSRLMNSLIDAVHNGKNVTVVVELQARFDEEANIEWSKVLTEAGVHVIFGAPGLKIHSKLLMISRREGEEIIRYAHIGTGNFHEKTARIYTDFSLLTADQEITNEVRNVFGYIENPYRPVKFNHLMVSPRNSRTQIYRLIDNEIANAKLGKKAALTIKVNNLVDKGIVNKLYGASTSGVKINMIIRGMCSLVPGIEGISDNIRIISIVDRFLEHPRVVITHNDGDPQVYISSADWMTRNIDHRIEVAVPVRDPRLKQRIIDITNIHFTDTVKARLIDKEMSNAYVPRGNRKKVRSQIAIYDYLKNIEKQTRKQNSDASNT